MRNILLIGCFGFIIILSFLSCSLSTRPYEDEYSVEVNYEQFQEYYFSMERRMVLWSENWGVEISKLPLPEQAYNELRFFEFIPNPGTTCYFNKPNRISIGSDKWLSGCVEHEIGHAVLYFINHSCWREFEHEEEKEKCLKTLK